MNPLDAREAEETYEYPARPYTLPMRPVQRFSTCREDCTTDCGHCKGDHELTRPFRALSGSGDVPTAQTPGFNAVEDWETDGNPFSEEAWSDKYLTAEDARVLRQDGM